MRYADQLLASFLQIGAAQTIKPAIKLQILMHRQLVVQRKFLRHVTDQPFDLFGFLFDIVTRNRCVSFGWFENSAKHANHCRFAGAIWTQKSKNRSARDRKADVIDRGKMAEEPRQIRALDHGLGHVTSPWRY